MGHEDLEYVLQDDSRIAQGNDFSMIGNAGVQSSRPQMPLLISSPSDSLVWIGLAALGFYVLYQ